VRITTNPILVEVTRGSLVESWHRGAIVVVDAEGKRRAAIGDVEEPVFPRSAAKALQALALVESGAADAYGLTEAELALACASHSGEPRHVETVAAMLARAGRSVDDLECGVHMPANELASRALILAREAPTALHNNCSGKHAGFICLACHRDVDPKGYVGPDHPVQREITATLAEMTGAPLDARNRGVDGCSIPAYAIPLDRLALGFARFITGEGLSAARATAAKRLADACMAEPWFVAGMGRFCTRAMALMPGRLFVKTGAEGVFCAAFPELGLGLALKCDDGAPRAAEAMMAAAIEAFVVTGGRGTSLAEWDEMRGPGRRIVSRRGAIVGEVRPVAGLVEALATGRAI